MELASVCVLFMSSLGTPVTPTAMHEHSMISLPVFPAQPVLCSVNEEIMHPATAALACASGMELTVTSRISCDAKADSGRAWHCVVHDRVPLELDYCVQDAKTGFVKFST